MKAYLRHIIPALFLSIFLLGSFSATAQDVPKVFMIGENEKDYEALVGECQNILLSVCDNSMEEAYDKWSTMLSDMEKYAEKSQFDLKGIKVWINVFWNNDGTFKNIVYYPKPNSKNMDFEELTSFLYGFVADYQFDVKSDACYSHFGSASFPTFARGIPAQEK